MKIIGFVLILKTIEIANFIWFDNNIQKYNSLILRTPRTITKHSEYDFQLHFHRWKLNFQSQRANKTETRKLVRRKILETTVTKKFASSVVIYKL